MEKHSEQSDFEKNNPAEQAAATKTEEINARPRSNRKIRGWLLFLLIMIGLTGFHGIDSYFEEYSNTCSFNGFHAYMSLFIGLFIVGWAGYTIYSFIKRERNAVFVAKCYFFIYVYISMLLLVIDNFGQNKQIDALIALMWYIICFCFLYYSKQVKEIFPKHIRKPFARDYYLMGLFMVTTLILLTLSIVNNGGRKLALNMALHMTSDIINNESLGENEYTDGQFAFRNPNGFVVERVKKGGDVGFKVKGNHGTFLLHSGRDRDDSYENFYALCEINGKSIFKDVPFEKISDKKREIHSNVCYHRIVQLGGNIKGFWQFAVLFDKESGKICIITYIYTKENKDYMDEVLSSIRFR